MPRKAADADAAEPRRSSRIKDLPPVKKATKPRAKEPKEGEEDKPMAAGGISARIPPPRMAPTTPTHRPRRKYVLVVIAKPASKPVALAAAAKASKVAKPASKASVKPASKASVKPASKAPVKHASSAASKAEAQSASAAAKIDQTIAEEAEAEAEAAEPLEYAVEGVRDGKPKDKGI
ncbi:hypothetical protein B0H10DRAFT_2225638 [Mycena sp. CBHHK59/15]|nr:hypothetical protein B0H10DRAFT_2225638 [Mycena sp. CBHHK59/15]